MHETIATMQNSRHIAVPLEPRWRDAAMPSTSIFLYKTQTMVFFSSPHLKQKNCEESRVKNQAQQEFSRLKLFSFLF